MNKRILKTIIMMVVLSGLVACGVQDSSDDEYPDTGGQNSLSVKKLVLEPGDICSNGGVQVEIGIDSNGNGVIDSDEIDRTEYVCNGEDGINSIVQSIEELPGDNCIDGGDEDLCRP